jgi:hypothetical protein
MVLETPDIRMMSRHQDACLSSKTNIYPPRGSVQPTTSKYIEKIKSSRNSR